MKSHDPDKCVGHLRKIKYKKLYFGAFKYFKNRVKMTFFFLDLTSGALWSVKLRVTATAGARAD